MYPHERSLVKQYEGRPFVFVGVNSDADRDQARQVMAREGLNCPCCWDGGGPEGPIARQYQVQGWPTVYVLDGQGIIRYAQVRGPALDQAIETLLQELEQGQNPQGLTVQPARYRSPTR